MTCLNEATELFDRICPLITMADGTKAFASPEDTTMRKIVQISFEPTDPEWRAILHVLCDDGTVWKLTERWDGQVPMHEWSLVTPIPQGQL